MSAGLPYVVVAVASLAVAAPLLGQRIAPPAPDRGVVVPEAYFQRLAQDPAAFTLPNGLFAATVSGPRPVGQLGNKGILILPALFSDSPEPHVDPQTIQRLLFDGPAPRGTLTEAYTEMSRGKLQVDGKVLPWVRTSLTRDSVVGTNSGLGSDANVGLYLLDALRQADGAVDFSLYDSDGPDGIPDSGDDDGFVDAMAFEFIEVAGSCGGPGIWPHRWGIASASGTGEPFYSDDMGADGTPIRVDGYIVQSAVDCGGTDPQDAATIAHEFGHVLGLPDYYHPTASGDAQGRRWVLGCWELMAAGSWGCGPHGSNREPFGPSHMSARTKNVLGWLDYITVGEVWDQEIILDPVQQSGQALRIPLDDAEREYLIIEYRSRTGFDAQIPAEGLLVYHLDNQGALRPNPGSGTPYFLGLVEQDDNQGLLRNTFEGGNRGEAEDAWGVGGTVQELHFGSRPSLRRNADGGATRVTFHEMSVAGGKARIRLSTSAVPKVVDPPEAVEVDPVVGGRIRVSGGVMPYTASATGPSATVVVAAEGDDLVLRGCVDGAGPGEVLLRVLDARGASTGQVSVSLTEGAWDVAEPRLVQPFLGSSSEPLSDVEGACLDVKGNGNGRYDVGDLRAWLRGAGTQGGG